MMDVSDGPAVSGPGSGGGCVAPSAVSATAAAGPGAELQQLVTEATQEALLNAREPLPTDIPPERDDGGAREFTSASTNEREHGWQIGIGEEIGNGGDNRLDGLLDPDAGNREFEPYASGLENIVMPDLSGSSAWASSRSDRDSISFDQGLGLLVMPSPSGPWGLAA